LVAKPLDDDGLIAVDGVGVDPGGDGDPRSDSELRFVRHLDDVLRRANLDAQAADSGDARAMERVLRVGAFPGRVGQEIGRGRAIVEVPGSEATPRASLADTTFTLR